MLRLSHNVFLFTGCKRLTSFVSKEIFQDAHRHMRAAPPAFSSSSSQSAQNRTRDKRQKDKRSGEQANRWVRGMPFCVYNKTGSGKRKCQKDLTPPLLKLMVGVFSNSPPRPKLKGKQSHLLRMRPFQLESSQVGKFLSMWTVWMCTFNRNPEHFCRLQRIDCWGVIISRI